MFLHLSMGWNYKDQLQKIYLKINNELQGNYSKYITIPEKLTENHIKLSALLKLRQKTSRYEFCRAIRIVGGAEKS